MDKGAHYRVAKNTDLPTALRRASAAGALATLKVGAQPSLPTEAEWQSFLAQHPENKK